MTHSAQLTGERQNEFGQCLLNLRRNRQMTQIELSKRARVSKGYVSFLENGVRQPSLRVVNRLCDILCPDDAGMRDAVLALAGFVPGAVGFETHRRQADDELRLFLQHCLELIRRRAYAQAQQVIASGCVRFHRPAQLKALLAHLELARGNFDQAVKLQSCAIEQYDLMPNERVEGLSQVDCLLHLGVMQHLWAEAGLCAPADATETAETLRLVAVGRFEAALQCYEQALEIEREHLHVLNEAGRVCVKLAELWSDELSNPFWPRSVDFFRRVLGHPHKRRLPQAALRESAAYLALANARCANFETADLILDGLLMHDEGPWLVPYIRLCVDVLGFQQRPCENLLKSALLALESALRLDPAAVRSALEQDLGKHLRPLQVHCAEELAAALATC